MMFEEFCKDPMKVRIFWGVVLVLLVLILLKLWGGMKENQTNREYKQMDPYTSGATQRFAQDNTTPYLQNCIEYVYDAKAAADRKTISKDEQAARDAASLAVSNVDVKASDVAVDATKEYLTGERGYAAHDQVHPKWLGHHEMMAAGMAAGIATPGAVGMMPLGVDGMHKERLSSAREGPAHWFIGDNIQDMKNEVSGQSPGLATNRWSMQLQNQVSDLRSDTVEGNLVEDTLFRRSVANM